MEEKDFDKKTQEETKLEWEAPRLISLDKRETAKSSYATQEEATYTGPS